jgi:pyridoxamine 5'-phosphate oxidase
MADREAPDPIALFREWLRDATEAEPVNPNAAALATATLEGTPSVRMVLLKGADDSGFTFYTNLESRKGRELRDNPSAAMCFYWKSMGRQVRVEGAVQPVTADEADAYFESRPWPARISAWASQQSRPLAARLELEREVAKYGAKYALGKVPRPPHWSGFRIAPSVIEFWRERSHRLHERRLFRRDGEGWHLDELYP